MKGMLGDNNLLDEFLRGPGLEFLKALNGKNGKEYLFQFKKFLRHQPTWGATLGVNFPIWKKVMGGMGEETFYVSRISAKGLGFEKNPTYAEVYALLAKIGGNVPYKIIQSIKRACVPEDLKGADADRLFILMEPLKKNSRDLPWIYALCNDQNSISIKKQGMEFRYTFPLSTEFIFRTYKVD